MPDGPSSLPLFDNIERPEPDDAPTVRVTAASDETIAARPLLEPPAPIGSGRLVRCAWPLLSLLARIVAGTSVSDPEQLKSGAAALIHQFERVALADGVNAREVNAARYVLCTAIDEAVLTSPRGGSSEWKNASLLSMFHNETWGGEKLFTLIDRALQDSQQYGDLLELCHFVLLLGFQGKFRLERDGSAQVDALRRRLFDVLRPRSGATARTDRPAGSINPLRAGVGGRGGLPFACGNPARLVWLSAADGCGARRRADRRPIAAGWSLADGRHGKEVAQRWSPSCGACFRPETWES